MIVIEDEKYIDVSELAQLFGLSEGTIYNWVSAKKIPSIKLGNKLIFHMGSINQWLQSNMR